MKKYILISYIVVSILFILFCLIMVNPIRNKYQKKKEKINNLNKILKKEYQIRKYFENHEILDYYDVSKKRNNESKFTFSKVKERNILFILLSKMNCDACLVEFKEYAKNINNDILILKFRYSGNESFISTDNEYPLYHSIDENILKVANINTGPVFVLYDNIAKKVLEVVIKEKNYLFKDELHLFCEYFKNEL